MIALSKKSYSKSNKLYNFEVFKLNKQRVSNCKVLNLDVGGNIVVSERIKLCP